MAPIRMPTNGEASTLHISHDATPATRVSRRGCRGRYVCCCSYGVLWAVMVWCGLLWRGVGCGEWSGLPVRRHSYGGHRVELWRPSDWLKNDKKQLKVKKSRQNRVYLDFIRPKAGQCALDQRQGSQGALSIRF